LSEISMQQLMSQEFKALYGIVNPWKENFGLFLPCCATVICFASEVIATVPHGSSVQISICF
jgi:hypothetical protein